MSAEPDRVPPASGVLQVVWQPGDDRLRGICHCGAQTVVEGPVEVWAWLLAHPTGHSGPRGVRRDARLDAGGVVR